MAGRTSVRLDPIARDIAVMVDEALSPKAQEEMLVSAAQAALAEAQETNRAALGYVPDHDTFIDGAKRTALTGITARSIDLTGWLWTGLIERISQDRRSWTCGEVRRRARSRWC
jgi:hypothetical protein